MTNKPHLRDDNPILIEALKSLEDIINEKYGHVIVNGDSECAKAFSETTDSIKKLILTYESTSDDQTLLWDEN